MRHPPVFLGLVVSILITGGTGSWEGGGRARASAAEPAAPKAKAPRPARAKPAPAAKTAHGTAASSEVTLQGDLTCAKCGLHESSTCQSVLVVKNDGRGEKGEKTGKDTQYYYLASNAVADAQHEKVCGGSVPVTITGLVTEEGGRKVLTASTVTPK